MALGFLSFPFPTRAFFDSPSTTIPTYSCCSFPIANAGHVASRCAHANGSVYPLIGELNSLPFNTQSFLTLCLLVGPSDGGKIFSSASDDSAAVETRVIRSIFARWRVPAALARDLFVGEELMIGLQ